MILDMPCGLNGSRRLVLSYRSARALTNRRSMAGIGDNGARASRIWLTGGFWRVLGVVATPDQVFHSLTSPNITQWWVRPGVFDTRDSAGDLRVGGRWPVAGGRRPASLADNRTCRRASFSKCRPIQYRPPSSVKVNARTAPDTGEESC